MLRPARLPFLSAAVLGACAGMGGPPQSAYQIPPHLRPQQTQPLRGGQSLDLARSRNYTFARASSTDPKGGNVDCRTLPPGGELILCELTGAGLITHVWCTMPKFADGFLRKLVLKAYWDGSDTPSILAPLGDFFGVPHGGDRQHWYSNAYFDWAPQWGLNCHLPMPFRKAAKLVVANESEQECAGFWYHVDYLRMESLPDDALYLCASYRQEFPAAPEQDFVFAEGTGRGHLLGVNLAVETTRDGWWGEGDDHIVIDGQPVTPGTGTGDYFGGSWNFGAQHAALWSGSPRLEEEKQGRRHLVYRFHANDPIPFKKTFRYGCEHGNNNDRADNWAAVAYWYQTLPHAALPALPPAAERLPGRMPAAYAEPVPEGGAVIEGEDLAAGAKADAGTVEVQDTGGISGRARWSGEKHLGWRAAAAGQSLTLRFQVKQAGQHTLLAAFTTAPDFGDFEVVVDQHPPLLVTGFTPRPQRGAPVPLGTFDLTAGEHQLTVRTKGKDERSSGFGFGLDCLVLR